MKKGEPVTLYAISIDPPDVSQKFAEKIASDGKGTIDFPILSDPGHKVIDMYGLLDPSYQGQDVYGIPHPAVYVIDKKGEVAWMKVESNYRERAGNAEIRTALDHLSNPKD